MSVRLRAFLMRNVMVQNEKELVLKELFYSTLICVSLSYFLLFFFHLCCLKPGKLYRGFAIASSEA